MLEHGIETAGIEISWIGKQSPALWGYIHVPGEGEVNPLDDPSTGRIKKYIMVVDP